jgi:hypothetical protein
VTPDVVQVVREVLASQSTSGADYGQVSTEADDCATASAALRDSKLSRMQEQRGHFGFDPIFGAIRGSINQ